MSYTVLARRYRSQTFDDVVGQDAISQTLKNAIKSGRVAHAFLLTGTRGVGKTTMARILAKALNCHSSDGPTTEPCCKCESCLSINNGDDVDVNEIDGASNNGVDQVRELRQNAIYRPARSRFKIYIIDEVHMLSTGAFNALLKILEEPPSHVKFIFATTEPNKVLETIQSRCQRFDFVSISAAVIGKQLIKVLDEEKIGYEEDVIIALSRLADGSMRDALSLLDQLLSTGVNPVTMAAFEQYLGQPNRGKIGSLIAKIGESDAAGVLATVDELLTSGLTAAQIVVALVDYMRDLMVIKSAGLKSNLVVLTSSERDSAAALIEKFDIAGIIYSITTLEKMRWTIKNSDTPRALLEAALLRLSLSEHFVNVGDLLAGGVPAADTGVKKKPIANPVQTAAPAAISEPAVQPGSLIDIESIRANWNSLLESVGSGAIAGVLRKARPAGLNGSELVLEFPNAGTKAMCENSANAEQVRIILSKLLGREIKVQCRVASQTEQPKVAGAKRSQKEQEEVTSDPAVQTVLRELKGKVIDIQ